jgi:hypothetical protein
MSVSEMSVLLDGEDVDEFCISVDYKVSMFPSPGMTVHPDWHRFLDNSFSTSFEEYFLIHWIRNLLFRIFE